MNPFNGTGPAPNDPLANLFDGPGEAPPDSLMGLFSAGEALEEAARSENWGDSDSLGTNHRIVRYDPSRHGRA